MCTILANRITSKSTILENARSFHSCGQSSAQRRQDRDKGQSRKRSQNGPPDSAAVGAVRCRPGAPEVGHHFRAGPSTNCGGLTLSGSLPALATWGEGSEAGQNIDPDSTEAYNRKILNATAICLTFAVFLVGLVVSQARKLVENRWLN
eukprot:s3782_g3.t1